MDIIFLLLILSSCTSLVLSADDQNDDYSVLLKIKEQLGNPPDALPEWVHGFDFCNNSTDNDSSIRCTSTGRVRSLALFDLHLSAPFPQAICDLIELEYLYISMIHDLYGPFPSCINKLINLRSFAVWGTNLSGPVPEFLNHNNLTQIDLPMNNLSGSIPPSLSKLRNLQYLNLHNNSLSGTIPSGLVPAPSAMIILSYNRLTGEIPRCYGWVNIDFIYLNNNQLSGDASFLFGKHKTATRMDLSKNQFEFDLSNVIIPENLTMLDLSFNKIYGKVPSSLASASQLFELNLSFNKLCGEIPQGDYMYRSTSRSATEIFDGNACLCGIPLPPCYNSAPTPAPL